MIAALLFTLCQDPASAPPVPSDASPRAPAAETKAEPAQPPKTDRQAPSEREAEGWRDFDRVLLVVNDDIVTSFALERQFQRLSSERNVQTNEDRRRLAQEIRDATVRARVQAQAGEALGFDPPTIERYQRDDFERFTRNSGGIVGLSNRLQAEGLTAEELKAMRRDRLYAELWEDAITGRGASTAARPARDRFVRPGLLPLEYRRTLTRPGGKADIGGSEDEVQVQQLLLEESAFQSPQSAHDLALLLRKRIADGEAMGPLVQQYSVQKDADGVLVASIGSAQRLFPALEEFFATGQPGELSDVAVVGTPGHRRLVLFRLLERRPARVPPLSEPAVQKKLADGLQKDVDAWRVDTALQRSFAGSYVWRATPNDPR